MNEFQLRTIASLPQEKQDFIQKQLTVFTDWMKGSMFMSANGRCYHCNEDVIKYELENGNDGLKSVTGCHYCHHSFCD